MRGVNIIHRCDDSGKLQLRQPVPVELQELVGKTVIKRSLEVSDSEKAEAVASKYVAEYEDLFEQLTTGKDQTIDAGIISYLLYCLRDQI